MAVSSLRLKIASTVHASLYRWTRGRVGGRLGRLPVLLLTTVGRKTGRRRTRPLVYLRDGETLVLVASNGGRDRQPAWFWNLDASGDVEVQINGSTERRAAVTAQETERERLWPEVVKLWPGYATYQENTKRSIPLVILRRA